MMKKRNLLIILVICIAYLVAYFLQKKTIGSLHSHGRVCVVQVTGFSYTSRPVRPRITYKISLGDTTFEDYEDLDKGIRSQILSQLVGRFAIAVVDSTNIHAHRILLTDEDFEKFNVSRPDSLFWQRKLIGK